MMIFAAEFAKIIVFEWRKPWFVGAEMGNPRLYAL
jgi:hypothetical protein